MYYILFIWQYLVKNDVVVKTVKNNYDFVDNEAKAKSHD